MLIDLVVTRHPAFVEYLKKHNMIQEDCQVIRKASPENVSGRNVIGILPICLVKYCNSYTEMKLDLPYKLAGRELIVDDFERHFSSIGTYKVEDYSKFKEHEDFTKSMVDYLMNSDSEWKSLEEYLKCGGDPFEHILFDVCSGSDNLDVYSKYIEKFANERGRERFEAYMDGLRRGYEAA